MPSALDGKGCVPETVDFTFTDNQMIAAELFAAFDNVRKGTDFDSWEKKVKLGDLTTGIDGLTDVPLANPENYKFVKFFVRDPMERACSQTRIYRAFFPGMTFILK